MQYISIKDPYRATSGLEGGFNQSAGKGKQMLPGGIKDRSALAHGYFKEFTRVMEGEAYSDPVKTKRQHRIKESAKNIGKPFVPSNGDKKGSGIGSHYGTIGGNVSAFSPQKRPFKGGSDKPLRKNFYTNPGKHGTGAGYVGVTLNPYHKHADEPFDRARDLGRKDRDVHQKAMKGSAFKLNMHAKSYFDDNPFRTDRPLPSVKKGLDGKRDVKPFKPSSPGKNPGGNKAGTFDPYPSHSNDVYKVLQFNRGPVNVVNKHGKTFVPSAGPKSTPMNSILYQNVDRSVNIQNYRSVTQVMSYG